MLIIPLVVILIGESLMAIMLIIPLSPVTRVALMLSSVLEIHPVRIVLGTIGTTLSVLLAASGGRINHLQRRVQPQEGGTTSAVYREARQELADEGLQTTLLVSCVLLGLCIHRMQESLRTIRKQQGELELLQHPEGQTESPTMLQGLLKKSGVEKIVGEQALGGKSAAEEAVAESEEVQEQVKGTLSPPPSPNSSSSSSSRSSEEYAEKLKKENSDLSYDVDVLQDVRKAGVSVAAFKKGPGELQHEFSRLLQENESLRSQLAVFDSSYTKGEEKKTI